MKQWKCILILLILFGSLCEAQKIKFVSSTYDEVKLESNVEDQQQVGLKELDTKRIFDFVHIQIYSKLSKEHQAFFKSTPTYKLLFSTEGDFFLKGNTDRVFVVFDRKATRISIVMYNHGSNQYLDLYREIKVQNGLETANCNYGIFGTLDYIIGDDIVYMKDSFIIKPSSFFDQEICRFADIATDSTYSLKDGCFSKMVNRKTVLSHKNLCMATSNVYNNWEALTYNKENNAFIIFYGQAYAD